MVEGVLCLSTYHYRHGHHFGVSVYLSKCLLFMLYWLVVWNVLYFPYIYIYIGNVIIPSD